MKLRVRVLTSRWAWSDPDEAVVLVGGDHALPTDEVKLTADLVKALAGAVQAGAVEILEADGAAKKSLAAALEDDRESVKAQAKAMEDGRWQEGNEAQHEVDVAAKAREA